jgi:hypothetical protein
LYQIKQNNNNIPWGDDSEGIGNWICIFNLAFGWELPAVFL